MKFLKKIFTKKEKPEVEEVVEEKHEKMYTSDLPLCGFEECGEPILPNAPRKKFHKKVYHMRCWRKLRKNAIKFQKGNL